MRSIDVIVRELCTAIVEGRSQRAIVEQAESGKKADGGGGPGTPRRSRRAMFPKDASPASEPSVGDDTEAATAAANVGSADDTPS
jgi:hypothetical protein